MLLNVGFTIIYLIFSTILKTWGFSDIIVQQEMLDTNWATSCNFEFDPFSLSPISSKVINVQSFLKEKISLKVDASYIIIGVSYTHALKQ